MLPRSFSSLNSCVPALVETIVNHGAQIRHSGLQLCVRGRNQPIDRLFQFSIIVRRATKLSHQTLLKLYEHRLSLGLLWGGSLNKCGKGGKELRSELFPALLNQVAKGSIIGK